MASWFLITKIKTNHATSLESVYLQAQTRLLGSFFARLILSLSPLTKIMSATIAHVRLIKNSAKKIKKKHKTALCCATIHDRYTSGLEHNKPIAQMYGSMQAHLERKRCAIRLPHGTPINPENIDTTPNFNDTELVTRKTKGNIITHQNESPFFF